MRNTVAKRIRKKMLKNGQFGVGAYRAVKKDYYALKREQKPKFKTSRRQQRLQKLANENA